MCLGNVQEVLEKTVYYSVGVLHFYHHTQEQRPESSLSRARAIVVPTGPLSNASFHICMHPAVLPYDCPHFEDLLEKFDWYVRFERVSPTQDTA